MTPGDESPAKEKCTTFDTLLSDIKEETASKLLDDLNKLHRTTDALRCEVKMLKAENHQLRKRNTVLEEKVKIYCPSRVNQALKRKSKVLCNLASEVSVPC